MRKSNRQTTTRISQLLILILCLFNSFNCICSWNVQLSSTGSRLPEIDSHIRSIKTYMTNKTERLPAAVLGALNDSSHRHSFLPSNYLFKSDNNKQRRSSLVDLPTLPPKIMATLPNLPSRSIIHYRPTPAPNPNLNSLNFSVNLSETTMDSFIPATVSPAIDNEPKLPIDKCGCKVQHIQHCCEPMFQTQLKAWFRNYSVPDAIKTSVSKGEYGQLTPAQFSHVPMFILRALKEPAIKWISVSQTAYYLSQHPSEIVATANLLRKIRQDHFNVLLSNLRTAVERGHELFSNLSHAVHSTVAWAARHQWGPYENWNSTHVSTIGYWLPYLPCDAFYDFEDELFTASILPAAVARQGQLSNCAKTALFTRMYRSGQLLDMKTWSSERTITFARLLTGAPSQILETLPQATMQNLDVLKALADLKFDRLQSEALLDTLSGTQLNAEQILAMKGTANDTTFIKYITSSMLIASIQSHVYNNGSVIEMFKNMLCNSDPHLDFRTGYQIFWWYRGIGSPRDWKKKDMQKLGCLARYFSPLDLARLDLFEMAKDIEKTYTVSFRGGDYSHTQARILFNYGSQLLHLGTSGWTSQRFLAIPPEIVPGMPIRRVSAFSPDEIGKTELLNRFKEVAEKKLGLNSGQTAALMQMISVAPGGIRETVRTAALDQSTPIIGFVPFVEMKSWNLTDFRSSKPPKLSSAQSNYWLKSLLNNQRPITLDRLKSTLFPFIHGLDCDLVNRIDDNQLIEILALIDGITQHEVEPAIAKCLKDKFVSYIESRHGTQESNIILAADDAYWPSLVVTAGRSIAQQFGGLELRKMSDLTCRTVVSVATDVGEARKFQSSIRPRGRRESFVRAALACLNRDPLSDFRVGLSDAVVLKYAMSDLPGDIYYRIPDEVLFKNLDFFQGGCLSSNQRRGLTQKLLSAMGPSDRWSKVDVATIGCLIYHLEANDVDKIPDSAFYGRIQALDQCFGQQYPEAVQFLDQCKQELTEEDYSGLQNRINHLNQRLSLLARYSVQVQLPSLAFTVPQSFPSNKNPYTMPMFRPVGSNHIQPPPRQMPQIDQKRFQPKRTDWHTLSGTKLLQFDDSAPSTYPYFRPPTMGPVMNMTCAWLKAAGGHIVSMPKETFTIAENMTAAEFVRCIPELGKYPHWPKETRDALWARVKNEIGFPSPPELEMMGHLLLGLTVDEISKMDFGGGSGLDLLHSLGSLSQWDEAQVLALASRFKSTVTPFLSDLDSVYITVLGSIVCGFSQTEIRQIRPEVYVQVSVPVGNMKKCTPWALRALSELAQSSKAFGPADNWGRDSVETVGIVVAGLDISKLELLKPSSLSGLTCQAASSFSPSQFQSFSTDQIKHFSDRSSMCIHSKQIYLLSQAQRFAVWEAGSEALAWRSHASASIYTVSTPFSVAKLVFNSIILILIPRVIF